MSKTTVSVMVSGDHPVRVKYGNDHSVVGSQVVNPGQNWNFELDPEGDVTALLAELHDDLAHTGGLPAPANVPVTPPGQGPAGMDTAAGAAAAQQQQSGQEAGPFSSLLSQRGDDNL